MPFGKVEIKKWLSARPEEIYPVLVTEFLGRLDVNTYMTYISINKEGKDGNIIESSKSLKLEDVIQKMLGLRNTSKDVMKVYKEIDYEF